MLHEPEPANFDLRPRPPIDAANYVLDEKKNLPTPSKSIKYPFCKLPEKF